MGIASKWIKSLVGIKKQGQNAEKLEKEHNAESSETVSHDIPFMFLCSVITFNSYASYLVYQTILQHSSFFLHSDGYN
jgi:hypothetical protein